MVSHRMIKPGYTLLRTILLIASIAIFASCNPTEIASTGRSNLVSNSDGHLDGAAYVFKESPHILTGGRAVPGTYNISKAVTGKPEIITENTTLTGNCTVDLLFLSSLFNEQLNDCIRSFGQETDTQAASRNADRMYVFTPGSEEFYNTNTLYHLQLAKQVYLDKIKYAYDKVMSLSTNIPNLYNGSNTPMAGIQLLASDWDHVHITDTATGNFKPCVLDAVTTADQGAEAGLSCVNSASIPYPDKDYDRLYKRCPTSAACTEAQKVFPSQAAAPVCLVQLDEGDSTRWVSQNEFRKKNGLSLQDKDCLGYSTSGVTDKDFSFNPHECMARFLPGANDAFFSLIEPRKNFHQTTVAPSEGQKFNVGNLLLLEVSKWVPPGTKFRCRMRARFSNCSDCYTDSANANDDYLDYELNGHKPYKVINFEFDVND